MEYLLGLIERSAQSAASSPVSQGSFSHQLMRKTPKNPNVSSRKLIRNAYFPSVNTLAKVARTSRVVPPEMAAGQHEIPCGMFCLIHYFRSFFLCEFLPCSAPCWPP
jgi:hypothetical protein